MKKNLQGTLVVSIFLVAIGITVIGLILLSEKGPGRRVVLEYVSHVESELREAQNALEGFRIEHARYPETASSFAIEDAGLDKEGVLYRLTTPVAYLKTNWKDPFYHDKVKPSYRYFSPDGTWYVLASVGPDRDEDLNWTEFEARMKRPGETSGDVSKQAFLQEYPAFAYDPSNGLASSGDIIRVGP